MGSVHCTKTQQCQHCEKHVRCGFRDANFRAHEKNCKLGRMECPQCGAKFLQGRLKSHTCSTGVRKLTVKTTEKQQRDTVEEFREKKKQMSKKQFCKAKNISLQKYAAWEKNVQERGEKLAASARSRGSGVTRIEKRVLKQKHRQALRDLVEACRGPPPSEHIWSSEQEDSQPAAWLAVDPSEALHYKGRRTYIRYREKICIRTSSILLKLTFGKISKTCLSEHSTCKLFNGVRTTKYLTENLTRRFIVRKRSWKPLGGA